VSLRFIELERFRNFAFLSLELDLRGGILEAPNGRGKTNFLEAVHYLSLFRSFRGAPDGELATFGERAFRVRGDAEAAGGGTRNVGVSVEGARKRLSVNGRPGRPADHVGAVTSVVLSPEDIRLVQGDPGRRRRYLDVVLALSSRRYLKALQEYRRVLRQRNRVLQAGAGRALIEPWTEQLVEHGARILADRLRFLSRWGGRLGEISARLAGSAAGAVRWSYEGSVTEAGDPADVLAEQWEGAAQRVPVLVDATPGPVTAAGAPRFRDELAAEETASDAAADAADAEGAMDERAPMAALAELLREELERKAVPERRRGMTLAGPHRDDVCIRIGDHSGRDLRRFGSQGEQRTVALALRVLESEVLTHERGELPIVLLDDVFSELDPARSRALLAFLAEGQQAFLTTPKSLAVELPFELPRYTVEDGRMRLVS
jgi:DNA replication and repair protein RecF